MNYLITKGKIVTHVEKVVKPVEERKVEEKEKKHYVITIPLSVYEEIIKNEIRKYYPYVMQWFNIVVKKYANELTQFDKLMLLLLKLLALKKLGKLTTGLTMDIKYRSKVNPYMKVSEWLIKHSGYDIEGLDTPDVLPYYEQLKKYVKEGKIGEAIKFIFDIYFKRTNKVII